MYHLCNINLKHKVSSARIQVFLSKPAIEHSKHKVKASPYPPKPTHTHTHMHKLRHTSNPAVKISHSLKSQFKMQIIQAECCTY